MKPISVSTIIDAPPEAVFAAMADFANAPNRIKEIVRIEMLTPEPVGVGTKFKETRIIMKHEETVAFEVTTFDPPHGYTIAAHNCGVDIACDFRCTPQGKGTKAELIMNGTAKTLFAKLMMPIMSLLAGTMKKGLVGDLNQIKAHLEAKKG